MNIRHGGKPRSTSRRQRGRVIKYSDAYQRNYEYTLTEPEGRNFDDEFRPDLSPKEMLSLGVFGGAYFDGVRGGIPSDLPKDWFRGVRLSLDGKKHKELNYFGMHASQPLAVWQEKGWIHRDDPHGWFQWYCRYWLGRRCEDDTRQIRRWKAIARHLAQVAHSCRSKDLACRPRQRQALLHWAYDSRKV